MRSIEMSVSTTPAKSEIVKTKNVHLENKAAINKVSIYFGWSETENAGGRDTDYKELKPGEMIFFSAEKRQILYVWAYVASGSATLSITGSDGSINKPSPDASRLSWYDRSPTQQGNSWLNSNTAPHAQTARVVYTCPASKKAMAESIDLEGVRQVAATAVARASVFAGLQPSGGSSKTLLYSCLFGNNVNDRCGKSLGASFMMLAGDVLTLYTEDLSTGGSLTYFEGFKVTEFDA